MKFDLEFELKNNELPLDYTRCFISFLKKSIQSVDSEIYESLYGSYDPKLKPYTFSLYLPNRKVEGERLKLGSQRVKMTFSCSDMVLAINFLNGFTEQKNKAFLLPDENAMTLVRFTTKMHPIVIERDVMIRFLSPLLVLKREMLQRKNYYLTWENEDFMHQLKENLAYQLKGLSVDGLDLTGFELTPIQPKRIGQRVFGQLVLGNLGIYRLKGSPQLIQFLLEAGLGSRRSAGFGLFEIISEIGGE